MHSYGRGGSCSSPTPGKIHMAIKLVFYTFSFTIIYHFCTEKKKNVLGAIYHEGIYMKIDIMYNYYHTPWIVVTNEMVNVTIAIRKYFCVCEE